jgi:ketosteroid isomerase-like protein
VTDPPEDTAALGRRLVDTFGRAWERTDAQALLAVFTPDAVFIETPFNASLTGTAGIRGYWQDLSFHQSEVRFASGEIFVVGPWFATEFFVTFRRRRTGEMVEAKGGMFCETRDGLISEMRLYWHRRAGGREILDR